MHTLKTNGFKILRYQKNFVTSNFKISKSDF